MGSNDDMDQVRNHDLYQARKNRKWSQEEVARRIGVDVRTYARWEQGNAIPRLPSLKRLCDVFKMKPDQLGFDPNGNSGCE